MYVECYSISKFLLTRDATGHIFRDRAGPAGRPA